MTHVLAILQPIGSYRAKLNEHLFHNYVAVTQTINTLSATLCGQKIGNALLSGSGLSYLMGDSDSDDDGGGGGEDIQPKMNWTEQQKQDLQEFNGNCSRYFFKINRHF